ncbi:hypothetical protein [Nocardia brasiliensis]|uniref:hypothetical protein n=1 Tax=Nocardia brasiliensis TaxID=37326 RepID=UPI00366E30DD
MTLLRVASGVFVAVACASVVGVSGTANARPDATVKVEKVTYVDELNVDVKIGYTCAKGEAEGVATEVTQTDPAPADDDEKGENTAGGTGSTEKITCNGKPQSVTVRVNQGNADFIHPGPGDVRATIYGSGGVIKDNEGNFKW